ncbi:hypothetical protein [Halobellus ruber]|uniref:Uncharacterized protein n=1 Tax=Halobellus ruber TaxID=2761102 RepID=A0A7J9SDN8_9EURY|nr:hypothetical protein [Halobellus ruber]MBB6645034.1 hypothetical protein [Halobellus ruber]
MKSRVRIADGLQQTHTTTVEHSPLATDPGIIEKGRQKLGLAPLALRDGEVLGPVRRVADGGHIDAEDREYLADVERHLTRVLETAESDIARKHAREALQHLHREAQPR